YFTINIAIIHWFERHRARALSAVGLGMALGGVFVPVIATSITIFGWRATAIGSGVFAIVAGLPLAMVFRGRPHTVGETIDGVPPARSVAADGSEAALAVAAADTLPGFTARQALRTSAFWLLSLGHAVALLVVTSVNVHAIT